VAFGESGRRSFLDAPQQSQAMPDASRLSLSLIIGSRAGLSISLENVDRLPPTRRLNWPLSHDGPVQTPQPGLCETEFWDNSADRNRRHGPSAMAVDQRFSPVHHELHHRVGAPRDDGRGRLGLAITTRLT